MIRDSFVFYKSFLDAIECFPNEVQIVLYKAVTGYALNGIEPQLNGAEKGVWALIKPQLDASINRRELTTNGKKRGAPMGNQNARKKTIQNNSKNNSENNSKTIQNNSENNSSRFVLQNSSDNIHNTNELDKTKNKKNKLNVNVNVNVNDKEKIVCKKETIHTHTQPNIFLNPENHEQQLIQSMQNAPMWQEDVCRCYKITQTQLQEHIEQFSAECRAKQTTHQNDRDIRSHFVDWLRYQLNKNQNGRKTTETNPRADYQETLTNAIANFAHGDT